MSEQAYTIELADLMEHEKVIERGLDTFKEVGWALLHIRDGRKYRASGYSTFEDYCQQRWGMTRRHADQTIAAAQIAGEIGTTVLNPTAERQVRPLAPFRDKPELVREAWTEAVKEADGKQPTAKHVERAVAKRLPPKRNHPAPFSDAILDKVAEKIHDADVVLDPFAGTGRVHELRERAGVRETIGVEIEPEWADKHEGTRLGDALDLAGTADIQPETVDAIVTSPTYGNRMADHHDAKDDSTRLTYKHTLGRDLADNNSGQMQWGDEYRTFHEKAWTESIAALKPGGPFVLNVKDHIRRGEKQGVAAWHIRTLQALGLELVDVDFVCTRGLMAGDNSDVRVDHELVVTLRKPA